MDDKEAALAIPSDGPPLLEENQELKQRLGEMQKRIQTLEQELQKRSTRQPISFKTLLGKGTVPLLALLLSLVPAILVMRHRWFGQDYLADIVRREWCRSQFLCSLQIPSYFLYFFLTLAALIVLLSVSQIARAEGYRAADPPTSSPDLPVPVRSRRLGRWLQYVAGAGLALILLAAVSVHHAPGWDYLLCLTILLAGWVLVEIPLSPIIIRLRAGAYQVGVVLFLQVSLVLLLSNLQGSQPVEWIFPLLFLLALGAALPVIKRISPIVWIIFLAEIFYTYRLNSWIYSIVGDEFSFFGYAADIVRNQNVFTIGRSLFSGNGVYGTHPYSSSLLQAVSMALLGANNFGWRFSSLFLAAASIGFFFLFFKHHLSSRLSLVIAVLLAGSHYLMNFGKIGYNNLQALFVLGLVLWASNSAIRHGRLLGFFALGLCMGSAFYVYPAALYVLPLPVLYLLFYLPPTRARALQRWAATGAGCLVLVFPLFLQPDFWQSKVAGTFLFSPTITESASSFLFHFGSNLIYTLVSYVYSVEQTHFVLTSYVDLFTGMFIPMGLILLIKEARREKFCMFALLAIALEVLLVGTTHDRLSPSATRMFLLLPWLFLCAAFGLDWIARSISDLFSHPAMLPGLLSGLLVICLFSNLFQAYHIYRTHSTGLPNLEVLFLRLLQHDESRDAGPAKSYLFIVQPDWGIDGIRQLQEVYALPDSQAQLLSVVMETPALPNSAVQRILDPNTLVIIQPWMEQTLRTSVEDELRQLGKDSCPVSTTPEDAPRFTLWYSPSVASVCVEANENR